MHVRSIAAIAVLLLVVSQWAAADGGESNNPPPGTRAFLSLKGLPMTPDAYRPEVAELVRQGVPARFAEEEWAAIVFTNELHQHLGIYSILGAKMGVRARELLQAPPRTVQITAQTGSHPPISCVLDGLQAGLGSTFAQDLIHAPETTEPRVAAVFAYKSRSIRLSLKAEFVQKIKGMIDEAKSAHGDLTPAYFEAVEGKSYQVWAEFDRKAIFDAEELPLPQTPLRR